MKILIALTYYRPHVSGLTIYVQRLAQALAARGHHVTVLTSQYDKGLPRYEVIEGVNILRVPVAMRVSKGVIMPTLGFEATREVLAHEVLNLHLPQLDAAGIALRGRLFGRPTVLTYHCDLILPRGLVNWVANHAAAVANRFAANFADAIVAYTEDYARNSPFLSRYLKKIRVIPPPVEVPPVDRAQVKAFVRRHVPSLQDGAPVIGMAARLATEKGVEYLLRAIPRIIQRHPQVQVLFAGQYENVLGEAEYARRLSPIIERYKDHWTFLGVLDPAEMASFYKTCDLTVLPSLNSTESFGLVQVESMVSGTPVIASNLPGVRQPVLTTGMGKIVPIGDSEALAASILEVLSRPRAFQGDVPGIAAKFAPVSVAERYEDLYADLQGRRK